MERLGLWTSIQYDFRLAASLALQFSIWVEIEIASLSTMQGIYQLTHWATEIRILSIQAFLASLLSTPADIVNIAASLPHIYLSDVNIFPKPNQ